MFHAIENRYHVLKGEIQKRCRELIIQICDAEDIRILKGALSKDHVHMHIEYPPSKSIGDIVKRLKGRTSRLLQQEDPELLLSVLGEAFLGNRVWSMEYWKYDGADGRGIPRASSQSIEWRQ